jgi:hypothetical protein
MQCRVPYMPYAAVIRYRPWAIGVNRRPRPWPLTGHQRVCGCSDTACTALQPHSEIKAASCCCHCRNAHERIERTTHEVRTVTAPALLIAAPPPRTHIHLHRHHKDLRLFARI